MVEKLAPVTLLSPLPYTTAGFAPIALMTEMGFDRDEGIDVTVRNMGIPGKAWRGLLDREGDATFINTNFTYLARDRGRDMRIFASYARHQNRAFVVPEESLIQSIEELKGKTLGLFALDHEEFANAALRAHGIDPDRDVRFVNFRHENSFEADRMAAALKSGEIEAIWLLDIMYGHLAVEGVTLRRLPSGVVDKLTPSSCLCTNDEVLVKNPEALAGLARALARATVFAQGNPEAAIKVVWRHEPRNRPEVGQEGRMLQRDRIGLETRLRNHGIEDPSRPKLGVINASEIEAWRDFLYDNKAISQRLPVDSYYTTSLMDKINDFDALDLISRAKAFKPS